MSRFLALAALALTACTGKSDEPPVDDTSAGHDSVDDTSVEPCTATVLSVEPADGATDVYYHDTVVVSFDGDGSTAAFTLTAADGTDAPVSAAYTEGGVQAELTATLAPSTAYTLTTELCGATSTSTFTTSSLGTPLEMDPSALVGATYMFRLSDADITEPAFLDLIAGTYLTVPILLTVQEADSASIHLIGGLGDDSAGEVTQIPDLPTWDFPSADFTAQPYFHAESELVTIMYGDTPIPIEQFNLSGTFAADGSTISAGRATGVGDTRYMASLVGKPDDDLAAICDLAAAAGVYCTECSDGEPYCLPIVAEHIEAAKVDGLTLVVVP